MEAKAVLKNLQMSPYKVRLVADLVRGRKVLESIDILTHCSKAAALPVKKVIISAVSNATESSKSKPENLYVKSIMINGARTLKRTKPRARGKADRVIKRASHIQVVVSEQ